MEGSDGGRVAAPLSGSQRESLPCNSCTWKVGRPGMRCTCVVTAPPSGSLLPWQPPKDLVLTYPESLGFKDHSLLRKRSSVYLRICAYLLASMRVCMCVCGSLHCSAHDCMKLS